LIEGGLLVLQLRRQYSGKHVFLTGFLILLMILLVIAASNYALFKALSEHESTMTPLHSNWAVREGDSPLSASGQPLWVTEKAADQWKPINRSPAPVMGVTSSSSEYAWFRVALPSYAFQDPALVVMEAQDLYEVYLRGEKIGQFGDLAAGGYQGQGELMIPLPPDAAGQFLYFRVYSQTGEVLLGKSHIQSQSDFLYFHILTDLKNGIILLLLLFIGGMAGMVYVLGWRDKITLCLSLFCFSACLFLFSSYRVAQTFLQMPMLYHYGLCFSFVALILSALAFFESVYGKVSPRLLRGLRWTQTVLLTGYLLVYLFSYQNWYTPYVQMYRMNLLVVFLICGLVMVFAYRKHRDREVQAFTLGFTVFLLMSTKDTLVYLIEPNLFRIPFVLTWMLKDAWFPYGLLALVLTLAFILVHRANANTLRIERYSKELEQKYSELSKMSEAYSRFVPTELLQHLEREHIWDVQLGDSRRKDMTIVFADIRSFSTLSETMTPEENFAFINSYLRLMEPVIKAHQGFIDKYIGDEIMALFEDEPDVALHAATEMLRLLDLFNISREEAGLSPISIGIGINSGPTVLGTIGGHNRMEGTVIGDAVNIASRLEQLNKVYGTQLLISEQTYHALRHPEHFSIRKIDYVQVKGKSEAVYVYEVFDGDPFELRQLKAGNLRMFTEAWSLFEQGLYEQALAVFQICHSVNPQDRVVQIYLERCRGKVSLVLQ